MNYQMALNEQLSLKDTPRRELIHNPIFGHMLKQKLDAAGVESHLYHGGNKARRPTNSRSSSFSTSLERLPGNAAENDR